MTFGGECLRYLLGHIKSIAVRVEDAITATVRRRSNISTWALELLSANK